MAAKTNTRNTERRTGKAWGKSHDVKAKVLSPEQQERRAAKKASRVTKTGKDRGLSLTMPTITWNWVMEMMVARWPNTRKVRMVDDYMAMVKAKPVAKDDGIPVVVESNPEAKPVKKSTTASSRKNGR